MASTAGNPSLLEAIVLGLVQGLTEFLPISSTAHLRITPELFGWPDAGAAYTAVIQLGTTLAVIIYFWKDIVHVLAALLKAIQTKSWLGTPEARLGWGVILGTIPIAVVGLALKKIIETHFRSLYVIASSLIVLAIVLFIVERRAKHARTVTDITLRDSLVVGGWQTLALIPGASRSGTTLTGALLLGFKREDAARFSFLLSIPATTLAGIFELKHFFEAPEKPWLALIVGTVVAFASGLAAIAWLLKFLKTRTTLVFVVYRIVLGLVLFALLAAGILKAQSGIENVTPETKTAPAKQVND
ncbi:MAG: undecaprenyl-diphosphate phosphatase [Myxococcaceae bacterium]